MRLLHFATTGTKMRWMKCLKIVYIILGTVIFIVLFISMFVPFESLENYCMSMNATSPCECITSISASFNQKTRFILINKLRELPEKKCLMSIEPKGRLGNLMGEYAALFSLSRLNGRPAFVEREMYKNLSKYFNLSLPVLDKRIWDTLPWTVHHVEDWMDSKYSNFNGHFVKIEGYPCSWTFYHHVKDEILREFTFHSHILDVVNKYLLELRTNRTSVTYVGIHIRRGDYVELMPSYYDGTVADAEYFVKAMHRFRSLFQDALFIICSDDLEWAQNNIVPINNDVVFGWNGISYSAGYDMALLSRCNHTIMTFGTFGYWSAYLAGGRTIYLTNFTRPGSKYLEIFHFETGYLPEWEGVSIGYLPNRSDSSDSSYKTPLMFASALSVALFVLF